MSNLVFVYGTLKRGLSNHGWLNRQVFLGEAITEPKYLLYDLGGYPGMVSATRGLGRGRAIHGEVWEVDASALERLHQLEGIDHGEYVFASIELQPPWQERGVHGYLYLRSVSECPDCGTHWQEG